MKKIICLLFFALHFFPSKSQWSSNPAVNNIVSDKVGADFEPTTVSDGANGSISFFEVDENIFAQRMTSAGTVAWGSTSNPLSVCEVAGEKWDLFAIPDGAGGAFVAWSDYRQDNLNGEIYVQKISAAGVALWTANGIRITNDVNRDDQHPLICLDGQGGIIITWYGGDSVVQSIQNYAQRLSSTGAAQWVANGIQVTTAAGFRASTGIVPDGANGAFIFFLDTRNDPNGLDYTFLRNNDLINSDIYGQRLDGSGARLWGSTGAAIITAPGNQNIDLEKIAVPDGSGNVILVFDDDRNRDAINSNSDIYAQKVNSNGVPQWAANGIPVCTAAEFQFVNDIKPDGAGGVIVSIFYNDIKRCYAQKVNNDGSVAWTINGVPVSPAGQVVFGGDVAVDGSGNSIFTVSEETSNFIKAYKLNSAGAILWGAAGITVCSNSSNDYRNPVITLSDAGSVIITWDDSRNLALPSGQDIYASKVLSTGVLAGAISGYVTVAGGNWSNPAIWAGGVVPPSGAAVQIRHAVSGNVNATCASLVIAQPGGNLSVLNGITISVAN